MDTLSTQSKYGKINIKVLRILFKVVIDDTYYEISCTLEYIKYLQDQIKRLNKIYKYEMKANNAKKDSDKDGKWVTIKGHPVFIEDSSPVHIVKNCYVEDMLPAKIIKSSFAQDCIDLRGTIRRVLCE